MNDKALREKALQLKSYIVEAPAGSGKTSLLTDRYLKLLTVVDVPEEIIAITFTKKAASEMKARILDQIKTGNNPYRQKILDRSKEKNWDIEHNISRLKIMTIDRFCHQVISQMPILSKMGDKPQITDMPEILYEDSVKQIIKSKDHIEDIKILFTHYDNEYEKIFRRLMSMMPIRDQWNSRCIKLLQKNDDEIIHETNLYLKQIVEPIYQNIKATLNKEALNSLLNVLRYLEDSQLRDDLSFKIKNEFNFDIEEISLWQTIANILYTDKNKRRDRMTVREGFKNEKESEIFKKICLNLPALDFLTAIKDIPAPIDETYVRKLKAIARVLLGCENRLRLIFRRKKVLDFVEMIEIANEALGKNDMSSELLLSLDYKISHLLIDEFQDTSRSHFNFLKKIVDGWTADSQKTIFCVGDPMQSIYKFREADVGIFIEAKKYGFNTIPLETIRLEENWRSSPVIVDRINHIFQSILPKEDSIEEGAISYKPFISANSNEDLLSSEFKFHALLFDKAVENIDLEEAKYVVNLIDTCPKDETMAILTRSRSHLSELINYIRKFKPTLAFNAVEIDALNQHQSVQDILSLSYAMLDLNDRMHWFAILRAPWCGLTLNDFAKLFEDDHISTVWEIIQNPNNLNQISEDGKKRLQRLVGIIDNAFKYRNITHIRRLIESVWMNLGGESCLHQPSDIIDINKFFDILQTCSTPIGIDFDLVEDQISKTYLSSLPSLEERIQFYTIHKAKGLEFDTVIIPALNSVTRNNEKKLIISSSFAAYQKYTIDIVAFSEPENKSNHLHDLIYRFEKNKEKNELKRLLYVGMTRAKKNLHLIASMKFTQDLKPEANSFLSLLWDIFKKEFEDKSPIEVADNQLIKMKLEEFVPKLMRLKI